MNEFESKNAPLGGQSSEANAAGLQAQVNLLLAALIVLSGTFAVFVWVQVRHARQDLKNMKLQANSLIQTFTRDKPSMDAFVVKAAEFGRTHPDFVPILKKYGVPVATSAPPAAATSPAPAKPAALN